MANAFDRTSYGSHARNADAYENGYSPAMQTGGATNPYSRTSATLNYGSKRKKKHRHRALIICLVSILVLVLGGAGAAFAYVYTLQSNMQSGVDSKVLEVLVDTAQEQDPFYMVLMGTDGSSERAENDEFRGDNFRTDSLMLARIDPTEKQVAIVSLMRDTMIDMGEYGKQKLNAAHAIGGPAQTVKTVSEYAGVPIAHFAEIDFDGFQEVVDALGGIDVDVAMEIDDPEAGGYVAAGPQTLSGKEALILCRSRHTYDTVGKGDSLRAANQRMVIGAMVKKLLSSDVATMLSTVQALSNYVTTDMNLSFILSLANSMRGIDMANNFYTAVNPTQSEYLEGVWWETTNTTEWKTMMKRIDAGLSPTTQDLVDPNTGIVMASAGDGTTSSSGSSAARTVKRTGTVSVKNGTGTEGVGAEAQQKIDALGYDTTVGNADSYNYKTTVVVYNQVGQAKAAQEIADTLGVGKAIKNNNDYLFTTDFLVVVGSDWLSR